MITILAASTGKNLELSHSLKEILAQMGQESEVLELSTLNLPLYYPEQEKAGIPQAACELTTTLSKSKGLVVVSPEYNGSLPPLLTNAIAWVSRSGSEDWRAAFSGKHCVVATHSGSGGDKALLHMRMQMFHLGCNVLARHIHTHYSKELNSESAKAILGDLIKMIS